jgi:hypothetical protein
MYFSLKINIEFHFLKKACFLFILFQFCLFVWFWHQVSLCSLASNSLYCCLKLEILWPQPLECWDYSMNRSAWLSLFLLHISFVLCVHMFLIFHLPIPVFASYITDQQNLIVREVYFLSLSLPFSVLSYKYHLSSPFHIPFMFLRVWSKQQILLKVHRVFKWITSSS